MAASPASKCPDKSMFSDMDGNNVHRARRIKCDETKPACLKCTRTQITCAGYPAGAPSARREGAESNSSDIDTDDSARARRRSLTQSRSASIGRQSLVPPSSWTTGVSEEESKLVEYALLLLEPHHIDEFGFVRALMNNYINQSGPICASSKAAAALFGIAIHAVDDKRVIGEESRLQPAALYHKAVNSLRDELSAKTQVDSEMLVSCILLTCAELAFQRWLKALIHLQVLQEAFQSAASSGVCQQDLSAPDLLFRMFDIHKLTHSAYTRVPAVEPLPLRNPSDIPGILENIDLLDKHIVETIHSNSCFIVALIYATCQDTVSEESTREYYQQIRAIEQCVELTTTLIRGGTSQHNIPHIMRLHNMCLATFLELHGLFQTTELVWDTHLDKFAQMVDYAERILEARRQTVPAVEESDRGTFSLSLGIIQPIYFVAMKCRQPGLRRRAIACLRKAGREGPWTGKVLATVAERCVAIEEVDTVLVDNSTQGISEAVRFPSAFNNLPASVAVPEQRRITACHVHVGEGRFDDVGDDNPANVMMHAPIKKVRFIRRLQADVSIKARVAGSAHIENMAELYQFRYNTLDPREWELWMEDGPFQPSPAMRSNCVASS